MAKTAEELKKELENLSGNKDSDPQPVTTGKQAEEQVTGPYTENDPRIKASLKRVLGPYYFNGLGQNKK